MSARSSSSSTTSGRRGSQGSSAAPLALGVKGRLSNQEMEQLKHQLAAAVAYDHVPEDARAERYRKPTSTPMTRVYRTLQPESSDTNHNKGFRPGIKPHAAIEYEKKFSEGAYDALRMRPAPRGIGASAKNVLQDEYVTRPREISVIPRNTHTEQCHGSGGSAHGSSSVAASAAATATGKRHAPAAIPQVFIL